MKLNRLLGTAALGMGLAFCGAAVANERGTSDEAVAMVKKAVAHMKEAGRDKAYADFGDTANKTFHDRDLYIFVYDLNGNNLSHGNNPKMVGKNLIDMRDADGKFIIKGFVETANTKGKGWVDYKWPNPVTKAVESKSSYIEKVDNVIVGAGIYK